MKKLLFTLAGIITFAGLSAQCSVIEIPLVQRVSASSVIVEGKVTEQYSYWNSSHTMIYTANKIELYKIFKGSVATDAIEIITEGGTVDMDRITVEPTLELSIGQEGMFTCIALTRVQNNVTSRNALPQYEAYASVQGFVKYTPGTNVATDAFRTYADITNELYPVCGNYTEIKQRPTSSNQRNGGNEVMAGPDPQSFSPATLNGGVGDVLEIFGVGFGATQGSGSVLFPNADDGGATFVEPLSSQFLVWQDDYIKLEVPAGAGTGTFEVRDGLGNTAPAPGTLTIFYAHLNVEFDPGSGVIAYQTDHVDDNGSGGYTWRMNTAFDANAPARASFMNAFETWRCATLVNWSIGSTTSINDAVSDGTNIICFDNTAPLSAGILGVCYSYWSGCASGPNIVWYVNELDIIFDEGSNISPLTWQFGPGNPSGSEYDFETVAVHELGHGHQLGHIISPGAIMHYSISNGTANRTLDGSDVSGGQFVQGKSIIANVCGPGAMSNTSCASLPVADFTASITTVCAGSSVLFSDLSTGSPTQWQWTFTGGSPNSSTQQNPGVNYNTPGVYDVTLVATNASGSDQITRVGYINVVAGPTVGYTSNPAILTVCEGTMVTLSGTGAVSYSWSGGITDGVPFAATQSDVYNVFGFDANGCAGINSVTVTVNPSPTISVTRNPSNGIVCTGNQATLTASGAQSYSWTGGVTNAVPFVPAATSGYTVTGTAANGCTATATTSLTVQSCSSLTQLNTTWCGATNCNLSQIIVANQVSGATNYEFWFQNVALNYSQTRVKGNNIANIPLSWIAGLQYGVTYQVRVRAYVGGVWQAYGPTCNLSMAAQIPTTQLTNCAATGLTLSSYLTANGVAGAADYEYEVTNATQPLSVTRLRGGSSNSIPLSWFSGVQYGRTYNCRVRAKVGGTWGSYGATCTFTMQTNAPVTQLTTSCNAVGLTHTSSLAYSSVIGATNYRVNIANSTLSYSVTMTRGSNNTTISLGLWTLQANTTYTVTVASYVNGAWSPFGPACSITTGGVYRLGNPNAEEEQTAEEFSFGLSMYPNPLMNGTNPSLVITGADQKDAFVNVLDLTGRVVASYKVFVEGDNYTTELAEFPDLVGGMYIMQVQVGDQVQNQKFIAE